MKSLVFRIRLFASLMLVGISSHGADQAKITFKTLDEDGHILAGMPVSAKFYQAYGAKGTSDTNGLFVLEGEAKMGEANYSARKEGYYRSEGRYTFSSTWSPKGGRFEPWNPMVTCIVRRIVNPTPMYAKRVETKIQSTNQCFGFDLTVGDWTAPAGNGSLSDLVFRVNGYWNDYRDNDSVLTLSFSRVGDGIREDPFSAPGSSFTMSRTAANEGYRGLVQLRKARSMKAGMGNDVKVDDLKESPGYVFRIRSVTNEVGVVTNACYGKIRPGMEFGGAGKDGCYLKLTYYMNPTPNDRNLEFDPKRNLFTNLGEFETVNEP